MGQRAEIYKADISNEKSLRALVEFGIRKFADIDVFVNCAATSIPPVKVVDLMWSDFINQIELNIKVNLIIINKLLPRMLDNKFGKIVTIGTIYSDKPQANLTHYITAKAALNGFTKSLALELAPRGINVNMVSPSVISTDLTADIPEKVKLLTASQTPLRRLAVVDDVAGAVSFLVSDKSNYLAGENIRINGGQLMI